MMTTTMIVTEVGKTDRSGRSIVPPCHAYLDPVHSPSNTIEGKVQTVIFFERELFDKIEPGQKFRVEFTPID